MEVFEFVDSLHSTAVEKSQLFTADFASDIFINDERLATDKIINDVINVIKNAKKIDVQELVRIRADVDCIIMGFLQNCCATFRPYSDRTGHDFLLSIVDSVEKVREYTEFLPSRKGYHSRTAQENIEELLLKPLRNDHRPERLFVRLLLLIISGQFDEACEFVFVCIRLLWINFPSDVNAHMRTCHYVRDSADCSPEERKAYSRDVETCLILSQMQLILELPNESSAMRKQKCSGPSSELLTATLSNIETFSSTYCSLFPILSFVVRVSFSMLCVMHRPDVADLVMSALRNHETLSGSNGKDYCAAMKRMAVAAAQTPSKAKAEQPLERGGGTEQVSTIATALEMGLPVDDAGALYVHKVDRDQANSMLSKRAVGSFLLRPHETMSEQFFLSFVSHSDPPFKHAVIRKERILDLDNRSNIRYLFTCGKIGPCESLLEILRNISSVLSHPLLFDVLMTRGDYAEQLEVSTPPHTNCDLNSFLWKELEPHADQLVGRFSLPEMKRSAVSRQHRDLLDSEHLSGGVGGGSKLLAAADVHYPYPEGAPASDYQQHYEGLEEDDVEDNQKDPSDTEMNFDISNGGVSMESSKNMKPIMISDSDCESGESKDHSGDGTVLDPNVPFMITVCRGWAFEKKSYFMFDMVQRVLSLQYVNEVLQRSTGMVQTVRYCMSMDFDREAKRETPYHSSTLLQSIQKLSPKELQQANPASILEALTHPIRSYVLKSEKIVRETLCPLVTPHSVCYIPPPQSYPDPTSSMILSMKAFPAAPPLTEDRAYHFSELILAETLLKLTMDSLSLKIIKLSGYGNGHGSIEHLVLDCLDMTDMQQLFSRWYLITTQYNDKLREISSDMSGEAVHAMDLCNDVDDRPTNTDKVYLSKVKSSSLNDLPSLRKPESRPSTTAMMKNKFQKISSHIHIPAVLQASLHKVLAHHSSSPSSSASSDKNPFLKGISSQRSRKYELVVKTINAINRLLHIDRSLTGKDAAAGDSEEGKASSPVSNSDPKAYADLYISWLSGLKIIHQVVKPPEHAFALPQTYYKYVDPWQVRVLSHYSLLDEKMRLGRNRYTGVTTTDASSKFGESPPRTSDKSTNSGAAGESGDAQLEISNSSFRSVMESVLQLRAIDSIVSNIGADAAAERDNKVSDSIKKNCDLFELWESIRCERYLIGLVTQVYPLQHKQQQDGSRSGGYYSALHKQLYRNALFCRLHMPYRFTAYIQVDLYHLKEVTRVSGLEDTELRAFEAGASSNTGSQSYHLLSHDAILQASQSTRVSSMDVFATIRLSRDFKSSRRPDEEHTSEQGNQFSSMGNLMAAANSANADLHATSRIHLDGTAVTPCHKAEPSRGPITIVTKDLDSGSQGPGQGGGSVCMYSRCGNSANYIQAGSDYSWREQALFRYALPEGIVTVESGPDLSDGVAAAAVGGTVHEHFYSCPDAVLVSVYERSFFSDNKLGDIQLSLSELSEKR